MPRRPLGWCCRFVADKGFAGAEKGAGASASAAAPRDGPVQFEKEPEDDPFGLGQLLKTAKETGYPIPSNTHPLILRPKGFIWLQSLSRIDVGVSDD